MITRLISALSIALFLTRAGPLSAAEHPQPHFQQLPQITTRPTQSGIQTKEVSATDISSGIKRHIASDRKKSSDKKFHVNYRGKDLALDLIKVHDDRLSSLGGGKYFACVDMKGTGGTIYDIDFFMAGQPGSMSVTETSVHKINGKPLYNWKEEDGVWKRVRVS
ncbi:MAG: hypothetical protein DME66_01875 [Verrucomicrobia bacterium]|nr:MAG: hypothetical protein DME66_01875 [Verrucomicrobiota bacterium]